MQAVQGPLALMKYAVDATDKTSSIYVIFMLAFALGSPCIGEYQCN